MIRERTQMATGCALAVAAVLGLVLLFASGCGSWQQTTTRALDAAHNSLAGISRVAEPAYEARCLAAAKACTAQPCQPALDCLDELHRLNTAILGARIVIHVGHGAVAAGDETAARGALARAVALATEVAAMLSRAGLIPGGAR